MKRNLQCTSILPASKYCVEIVFRGKTIVINIKQLLLKDIHSLN